MTEKLFYEDSYIRTFLAVVQSCKQLEEGYEVVLDRTVFFPEGGGQSADTGTLSEVRVTDVREREGIIYHQTEGPIEVGETIIGTIDDMERFSKMQQHTGEHIVSGLIHEIYGYNNVGFHLGADTVTMDFDGSMTRQQLREIEFSANQAVVKNVGVSVQYPSNVRLNQLEYRSKIDIEGQVRIVTIPGYDVCACCAPHVQNTGEIGMIKLTGIQNYKGGVRISMLCGFRALADYQLKEDNTRAISMELSAKEDTLVEAVCRQKEEVAKLKEKMAKLQSQILQQMVEDIPENQKKVSFFQPDLTGDSARELVNIAMEKGLDVCAVFFGAEAEGYRYIIRSGNTDARDLAKKLNAAFDGKGGGKPAMVQGSVNGEKENLQRYIDNL